MAQMLRDLKLAARMLLKNPGFSCVAILSLALGIGATTALFSVVYGVLISPYPYKEPGKIWAPSIETVVKSESRGGFSPAEYLEMEKLSCFAEMMATSPSQGLLTGDFAPETVRAIRVTGGAFNFLGVPPLCGRTIQPTDILSDGTVAPVVVLSFQFWQRLFSSDPSAIGKTIRLNDETLQIVGVMPPRFGWWTSDGVWTPVALKRGESLGGSPIARLKEGVTAAAAEQQLQALFSSLAQQNPKNFPRDGFRAKLTNYLDMTVASGEMQRTLWLLFGAVIFLLLIACANVANLQLARGSSRFREMAIRLSVGAGRGRLIRQLLTESVLLSVLGGALGLLFAFGITKLMVSLMPENYVPNESRVELNWYVLGFCLVVSMATGILFGLAPALQSVKVDLVDGLKDSSKGADMGGRGGWLRKGLVVSEVALAVVLLVSAGLTVRSFMALQNVSLGFNPEEAMVANVPMPPQRYPAWAQRNTFAEELLRRVSATPGVQAASIGNGGTPFWGPDSSFVLEGHPVAQTRSLLMNLVSSNYFSVMQIPFRAGRNFTEAEIARGERVAVINESLAKLWPVGIDPIGRRIGVDRLGWANRVFLADTNNLSTNVTVIGVVADTRNVGFQREPRPGLYLPYTVLAPPQRTLAIRSKMDMAAVMSTVRAHLREMDRELPLARPTMIEKILGEEVNQPRFTMALFSFFAAIALILAAAGIYSVLSYMVSQRTREIGVRMALGAQLRDVLKLVLGSGARLVLLGLVLGVGGGLAATRLLSAQLFQIRPTDPIAYIAVVALLVLVAALACLIPARRAAKVNPTEALRYE
jgi:putative ABC transport system permease protein